MTDKLDLSNSIPCLKNYRRKHLKIGTSFRKVHRYQSSEQVTISCSTRVSKIPKYLDT